jgi:hypothetical protein
MKANELRIGNWVKGSFLGELCKVTQLGHEKYHEYVGAEGIGFYGQNGFEPIPLTPEILVKAGFKRDKQGHYRKYLDKGRFFVLRGSEYDYKSNSHIDCLKVMYYDNVNVIYLHQLQNLYFALTGKELTFDL